MKKNHIIIGILILVTVSAIAVIIFRNFFVENVIGFFGTILWFLLRIFFLWIDQKILWIILISVLVVVFFFGNRFAFSISSVKQNIHKPDNEYMRNLEFWKMHFSTEINYIDDIMKTKRDLLRMLVSMYASKKRIRVNYKLYESFENREIQIPDEIYSFLYGTYGKRLKKNDGKNFKRLTKKEAVRYHEELDVFINYLENYMESKHGKQIV